MRILLSLIAGLFAMPWTLPGQISVEVVTDQEQFLRDESVVVKVRVTNRSGQTLTLGRDNEWLSLTVESLDQADHAAVGRLAEVQVQGEFKLDSAQLAIRQVNLTPCFDIGDPGRYQVSATLRLKEWSQEILSKPRAFEVVRGTKLWEQEFGVPQANGAPEGRKYILQQANYRKQMQLYFRLTDISDQNVRKVFPLGPLVSFNHPEAQLDKSGYLHILFQTGARSFFFYVITPDGEIVLRQTYDYSETRPGLRPNEEGRVYVSGGARRLAATDIPAGLTSTVSPSVLPPAASTPPPATNPPAPPEKKRKAKDR